MPVPEQNPVSTHAANGITTVYSYGFLCLDPGDIVVIVDYVEVDRSTYGVLSFGSNTGGEIEFIDPPTDGLSVIIRLVVRLDRDTNYQFNGDFMTPVVNRDFDRLWLSQQSQQVDLQSAMKVPPGETAGLIPSIAVRKGKALVFNAVTGQPEPSVDDYNDQAQAAAASAQEARQSSISASSAAGIAANAAQAAALSAQEAADVIADIAAHITVEPVGNITAANVQAALEELDLIKMSVSDAQWLGTPIGCYITPKSAPPTDDPRFRYVLCTAGQTGAGGYNEGVLTGELVTGSAPLVQATATVSLAESPFDGEAIHLINTEKRFIGAGAAEAFENDSFQNITGEWSTIGSLTAPIRFTDAITSGAFATGTQVGTQVLTGAANSSGRSLLFDASLSESARTSDHTQPSAHRLPHYRRIM